MPSSVDLGDRLERYVDTLVRDGRYGSRSEVLREGVRLVEDRERRLAAIAQGVADAEAGRTEPTATVAARLTTKYTAQGERAQSE